MLIKIGIEHVFLKDPIFFSKNRFFTIEGGVNFFCVGVSTEQPDEISLFFSLFVIMK